MEVELFEVIKAVNKLKDTVAEMIKQFDILAKAPVFDPGPEYLDEEAACNHLYVSKRTLAKLRANHILPYIKSNRKILFRLYDLNEYLNTRCLKN